jgi:predicted RNase H-like HicB family nuclease
MRPPHAYDVVIYWSDKDGRFLAEVPELPGCAADGGSLDGAAHAAYAAIDQWIDAARRIGRPIPAPRGRPEFVGFRPDDLRREGKP